MTPEYAVVGIGFIIMTLFVLLCFFIIEKLQRILDRYRLKYSFDREIESKECSKVDTEEKLNRRERNFKRRTFKD